jgi:hypothetical protein
MNMFSHAVEENEKPLQKIHRRRPYLDLGRMLVKHLGMCASRQSVAQSYEDYDELSSLEIWSFQNNGLLV